MLNSKLYYGNFFDFLMKIDKLKICKYCLRINIFVRSFSEFLGNVRLFNLGKDKRNYFSLFLEEFFF